MFPTCFQLIHKAALDPSICVSIALVQEALGNIEVMRESLSRIKHSSGRKIS
jgi:hypothetical protein